MSSRTKLLAVTCPAEWTAEWGRGLCEALTGSPPVAQFTAMGLHFSTVADQLPGTASQPWATFTLFLAPRVALLWAHEPGSCPEWAAPYQASPGGPPSPSELSSRS